MYGCRFQFFCLDQTKITERAFTVIRQTHELTANKKKEKLDVMVMLLTQICLVKQVNKETQVHFLVGGCSIQRSLYFQIFNFLNFLDCEDKILRKFLLTSQITTTGHMDLTQFKKYLSLDNFNFSILTIRRVFEGFRDSSEQQ